MDIPAEIRALQDVVVELRTLADRTMASADQVLDVVERLESGTAPPDPDPTLGAAGIPKVTGIFYPIANRPGEAKHQRTRVERFEQAVGYRSAVVSCPLDQTGTNPRNPYGPAIQNARSVWGDMWFDDTSRTYESILPLNAKFTTADEVLDGLWDGDIIQIFEAARNHDVIWRLGQENELLHAPPFKFGTREDVWRDAWVHVVDLCREVAPHHRFAYVLNGSAFRPINEYLDQSKLAGFRAGYENDQRPTWMFGAPPTSHMDIFGVNVYAFAGKSPSAAVEHLRSAEAVCLELGMPLCVPEWGAWFLEKDKTTDNGVSTAQAVAYLDAWFDAVEALRCDVSYLTYFEGDKAVGLENNSQAAFDYFVERSTVGV